MSPTDAERPAKAARDQDARVRVALRGRRRSEEGGGGDEEELLPGGGQLGGHHREPERARDQ